MTISLLHRGTEHYTDGICHTVVGALICSVWQCLRPLSLGGCLLQGRHDIINSAQWFPAVFRCVCMLAGGALTLQQTAVWVWIHFPVVLHESYGHENVHVMIRQPGWCRYKLSAWSTATLQCKPRVSGTRVRWPVLGNHGLEHLHCILTLGKGFSDPARRWGSGVHTAVQKPVSEVTISRSAWQPPVICNVTALAIGSWCTVGKFCCPPSTLQEVWTAHQQSLLWAVS